MEFTVRRCGPGDEAAVSLIGQATILETYAGLTDGNDLVEYVRRELSSEAFREILASDRARVWVAETSVGRCMAGYAVALSEEDGEPFAAIELKRLYLFHRFHGIGLGKRLMDEVLAFAREKGTRSIRLQVHSKNGNAIEFYERYGFEAVGEELFRAGTGEYRVVNMQLRL